MGSLLKRPAVRRLSTWFITMYGWSRSGSPLWLTLVVLALVCAYLSLGPPFDDPKARARYAGTLLQLAGIATVYIGLNRTRREFGLPSLTANFSKWLRSIPWRGPRVVSGSINMSVEPATMVLEGQVVNLIATGQPVERRLDILEVETRKIREELTEANRQLRREQAQRTKEISGTRQQIETRTQETSRLLASVHTGGMSISIAGLFWLALGVVLASIPDEISMLLSP